MNVPIIGGGITGLTLALARYRAGIPCRVFEAAPEIRGLGIVMANRTAPPDTILRLIHERTGDRPFTRIEDVISADELRQVSDGYKKIAGFDRAALSRPVP